ncbi:DUF2339 domain-containing protein [Thalassotalea marina]|uniref:DUF2339 domain-containing protein n=1 Tax=Thalassotalea marina TaxID=1673741 RepID=A0A919BNG2_9GAMM|nr:DUF2339 domain-containing protein [Thalassotalea marina]GHG03134.1 hypothetical protein GCM10017161_35330 [Thalassotalea marina]
MEEEIKALRSELALMKLHFREKVGEIESKLNALTAQENAIVSTTLSKENKQSDASFAAQTKVSDSAIKVTYSPKTNKTSENVKPSLIAVFFVSLLANIFDWFSPVVKIYQSYKERNMLGTLFLTIAGIGLTLAGFGYLMQLLIDQLGTGAKAMLMCFAALLVIALGIGLKVKTRYGEFATAIVSLGILLSYNTVYFSGSVYQLIPLQAVLLCYLAVALMCHGLALLLDTKIVAALGIIGIATMPILSNTIQVEPTYYLLSLALITASSLVLALKRVGQWLANLALAFSLVSIEWVLSAETVAVSAWILEVFYLLFYAYIVAVLYRNNKPTNQVLIFLATTIGASILMFYQAVELQSIQMSFNFVLNTAVAVVTAVALYRFNRQVTVLFALVAAIWGVLAIISLVSNAYWGMAWAAEGLLLIYIGRKFLLSAVANQGQLLAGGAILFSLVGLGAYFPLPALVSFDGWLLSLFIVAALALWQRAIHESPAFNDFTKFKVKPALQLVEVVWLTVLAIATLDIWLAQWTGAIIVLGQLALLCRAKYCKQTSIEIFAALLITVPIYYLIEGAQLVGSYHFTDLPMYAKLSLLSAFAQLWLWSEFYRRYQPHSQLSRIAEAARIGFYLLVPVCWLGSAVRHLSFDVLTVLWLSPLLALLLAKKITHQLLELECKVLTVMASITLVLFIADLSVIVGLISIAGFVGYFFLALKLDQKYSSSLSKFICTSGLITLGIAVPVFTAMLTNKLFIGMLTAIIYWAGALYFCRLSSLLKRNQTTIVAFNLLLVVSSWILILFGGEYTVIAIIFILVALYQKDQGIMTSILGRVMKENIDLFFHSVFAITYVLTLANMTTMHLDLLIAPALAVHGAVILFLKDKRLITVKYSFALIGLGVLKLAFIDAANALLWQKVMLFMGIGVFILLASFWYQKLVSQSPVTNSDEELTI